MKAFLRWLLNDGDPGPDPAVRHYHVRDNSAVHSGFTWTTTRPDPADKTISVVEVRGGDSNAPDPDFPNEASL